MGMMTLQTMRQSRSMGRWGRRVACAMGVSCKGALLGTLAGGIAHADQPVSGSGRVMVAAPLAPSIEPTAPSPTRPPASVGANLRTVFVEDMTWTEVRDALAAGVAGALLYAGSTEQNGPHLAIGKHTFIARRVAEAVARTLGNVLVYPIMPFAPTGDPAVRSGHMRFPGSVSLSAQTYALVMAELAASAHAAGFTRLYLMGDHGGGEAVLARLAIELDRAWAPGGVRVLHVSALLARGEERGRAWLAARGEASGEHAGLPDTAMLMAIDPAGQWVHANRFAEADAATGVDGDPRGASPALGQVLLQFRVEAAVEQIRVFEAGLRPGPASRPEPAAASVPAPTRGQGQDSP